MKEKEEFEIKDVMDALIGHTDKGPFKMMREVVGMINIAKQIEDACTPEQRETLHGKLSELMGKVATTPEFSRMVLVKLLSDKYGQLAGDASTELVVCRELTEEERTTMHTDAAYYKMAFRSGSLGSVLVRINLMWGKELDSKDREGYACDALWCVPKHLRLHAMACCCAINAKVVKSRWCVDPSTGLVAMEHGFDVSMNRTDKYKIDFIDVLCRWFVGCTPHLMRAITDPDHEHAIWRLTYSDFNEPAGDAPSPWKAPCEQCIADSAAYEQEFADADIKVTSRIRVIGD